MEAPTSRPVSFLSELRRRRVLRTAVVYLAVGLAAIEVTDIISQQLGFPGWVFPAALIMVVIGFPIALIISWHYNLTPRGFRPTEPRAAATSTGVAVEATEPPPESRLRVPERSIAVLPFNNLSRDPDHEYFSDGITEEIINALTHVSGLHVAARTSSFSFKGEQLDVTEIAERLNVATVLEGSVRRAGTQIRITAQLVDCTDGYHLWSESYDREMEDVFAIQDEIARAITERLKMEWFGEGDSVARRQTENLDAYHEYLRGRYVWNLRTAAGLRRSIDFFDAAIATDERYALAYAGLADAYSLLGWYRRLAPDEAFQKTKWAARAAIDIDDSLAEAHTSLAYARFLYDWDWEGAEADFMRAIELNPGYSTALHWYAEFLMSRGRLDEAQERLARASRVDPLSLSVATGVGWVLYFKGEYEAAIQQYEGVLSFNPNFVIIPWFLGPAYVQAGQCDRAIALYEHWLGKLEDQPGLTAFLAHALAVAGRREEASRLLGELESLASDRPDNLALVHAGLGDADRALDYLEDALEHRSWPLVFLGVEPAYSGLRSEPRFSEILAKIDPA